MSGERARITRWGIVGTGPMAAVFARGLADAPGAQLAAVASRTPARARAFAARYGALRAHDHYAALAEDPGVDLVYVATPHSDHRASAMTMLDAGKPVVCEKPFTLDAAESRDVIALARRRGLFCMEAMWMRFMPAVRELVDRLRGGVIGEPRAATIELGHAAVFDGSHRLFDPALGGGALLDLGCYAVSFALLLFGPPTSVKSQVVLAPNGVDEHVTALLGHAGGRQSIVSASLRTRLSNGASVAGTAGIVRLHEPLYRPDAFSIVRTPKLDLRIPSGVRARLRGSRWLAVLRDGWRTAAPSFLRGEALVTRRHRGSGYQYEAIEAMRCLHAGELESPLMPLDETQLVMETLDAIRASWSRA
jgi:predicted dehydrogenase